MAYTISKSDGTTLGTVADLSTNNTLAPIVIEGRGVTSYGQTVANDLVWLSENFANAVQPNVRLTGMIWYDKSIGQLKLWDGTAWNPMATKADVTSVSNTVINQITILTQTFRQRLQSNVTIYVAPSGSDSNDGSSAHPFLTLQKAWNFIVLNYDLNGYIVTIQVEDGTYSAGVVCTGAIVGNLNGVNGFLFKGNYVYPQNVVISTSNSHCFFADSETSFSLGGFSMTATGTNADGTVSGICASNESRVLITAGIILNGCSGSQIFASQGSTITATMVNIKSTGTSRALATASANSSILFSGVSSDISTNPTFTDAFIVAANVSFISAYNYTYSGACTGIRFSAGGNSIISSFGNSPSSYFPGNANGTLTSGAQFL